MTRTISISRSDWMGNLFLVIELAFLYQRHRRSLLCVSILDVSIIQGGWKHAPTLHAVDVLLYRCIVQRSAISRKEEAGIFVLGGRKKVLFVGTMLEHYCEDHKRWLEESVLSDA